MKRDEKKSECSEYVEDEHVVERTARGGIESKRIWYIMVDYLWVKEKEFNTHQDIAFLEIRGFPEVN